MQTRDARRAQMDVTTFVSNPMRLEVRERGLYAAMILCAFDDVAGAHPCDLGRGSKPATRRVDRAESALGWLLAPNRRHRSPSRPHALTVHDCCRALGVPVSSVRARAHQLLAQAGLRLA